MDLNALASIALAVLVVVLVVLAALTASRRATVDANDRRTQKLENELRPQLLRLLATDDPDLARLAPSGRHAGKALDAIAAGLLPKLRGADRSGVVDLLTSRGIVRRALKASRSNRAVVRARAAEELGNLGLNRTRPVVAKLLTDRHPEVRAAAARALGKIGDAQAVPALLNALDRGLITANVASMALMRLGLAAIEPLQSGLQFCEAPARVVSCELLGLQSAIGAVPALAEIATGTEPSRVRLAAVRALGRIGSPLGLPPLLTCLHADEAPIRAEAARSLGRLGTPMAVVPLSEALLDEHDVAFAAATALSAHGAQGAEKLAEIGAESGRDAQYANAALAAAELERARYASSRLVGAA
jgi:HEAT repeat protein